jgi:hypothetical protein
MRFRGKAIRRVLFFLPIVCLLVCFLIAGKVTIQHKKTIVAVQSETANWSQYPNPRGKLTTNQADKLSTHISSQISATVALGNDRRPPYKISWAHPTNYGERYTKDINGLPVHNQPIIVLHETDAAASSVLNFFQEPHFDESVQASYHTMIEVDGTVVYIVPPEKRAFGAANSEFDGYSGAESVQTNPHLPSSVNNFAYHVSLETPPDGYMNSLPSHSSYTEAQYHSLAWLIAQSNVPDERITTHKIVDRSGQKIDPRSFDFDKFLNLLHEYRRS